MKPNFKCPRCKKGIRVGRLRSSYTCPNCKFDMLITREDKQAGYKIFRK